MSWGNVVEPHVTVLRWQQRTAATLLPQQRSLKTVELKCHTFTADACKVGTPQFAQEGGKERGRTNDGLSGLPTVHANVPRRWSCQDGGLALVFGLHAMQEE